MDKLKRTRHLAANYSYVLLFLPILALVESCSIFSPSAEKVLTHSLISSSCLEKNVAKLDAPTKFKHGVATELIEMCRSSLEKEYDLKVAHNKSISSESTPIIDKNTAMLEKAMSYVNKNRGG